MSNKINYNVVYIIRKWLISLQGVINMIIDENRLIVGTGSWYYTQSKKDYPYCETVREYLSELKKICDFRFSTYNIEVGQKVRVTVIGGKKVMRYTGMIKFIQYGEMNQYDSAGWHYTGSALWLQQNKCLKRFDSCEIDDIEILNK